MQHLRVHRQAGFQRRITQLVGRRQARVLQAAEEGVDFLLQTRALIGVTAQRAHCDLVVLDLLDQGLGVLDENATVHTFFLSTWGMRTGMLPNQ